MKRNERPIAPTRPSRMVKARQDVDDDRQHRQLVDRVRASIEASCALVETLKRPRVVGKPSKE
jgi:hypothetical protein